MNSTSQSYMNFNAFLRDCFPDFHHVANSYTQSLFFKYIGTNADVCPEIKFAVSYSDFFGKEIIIRNPTLLPFQILGAIVGLYGYIVIRGINSLSVAYSYAFLNFCLMNISSIFAHNFYRAYSENWHRAIDIDVSFTCASCLCLILVAISSYIQIKNPFFIKILTPICVLLRYFVKLPFVAEIMYLGALMVACISLFIRYYTLFRSTKQCWINFMIAAIGVGIFLHGISFERNICEASNNTYSSISAVFFGCSVAFIAVLLFYKLEIQLFLKSKKIM